MRVTVAVAIAASVALVAAAPGAGSDKAPGNASVVARIEVVPVGRGPFPAAAAFGDIWVPSSAGTEIDRLHIG